MRADAEVTEWCMAAFGEALMAPRPVEVESDQLAEGSISTTDPAYESWIDLLREPAVQILFVRVSDGERTRLLLSGSIALICLEGVERSVICQVDPDLALAAVIHIADVWCDGGDQSHAVFVAAGGWTIRAPAYTQISELLEWIVERLEELDRSVASSG